MGHLQVRSLSSTSSRRREIGTTTSVTGFRTGTMSVLYSVARAVAPTLRLITRAAECPLPPREPPEELVLIFLLRVWVEVVLPRPDNFKRWTLPMTAFRLTPPSCAAIWLA